MVYETVCVDERHDYAADVLEEVRQVRLYLAMPGPRTLHIRGNVLDKRGEV